MKWLQEINTKANGLKAKRMEQDFISLLMVMCTRDSSRMEIDKAKEAILGLTKAITKENGWQIK